MEALETLTDEELVALYAQDVNEAFDLLLSRHKNKVFSYIYLAVKDRDLANDLFQETFVKAIVWFQEGRYSNTGKFMFWLTRIAHTRSIYREGKIHRMDYAYFPHPDYRLLQKR